MPAPSISIEQVAGDPLGTAKFQVIDSNASIPLQVLQEVIFWDETLALTPGGTVPAPYSDTFATNTSTSYTQTNNPSGSPATWTWTPASSTTPLTAYLANAASATISTADQLYTTTGSPTTANTLTACNSSTGWGEVFSQGSAAAWPALGSIGAPSGKGFFLDATSLNGQTITGNWSGVERLSANSATGTVTTNIVVRVYKYSAGVYTSIVSWTLTGQVLPSATPASITLASTAGTPTSFATGDKLYIDYWCNITSNTSGVGQQIRHNRLSTDTSTFTGDPLTNIISPGYATTNAGTLAASSGLSALLLLKSWTALNVSLSATMTVSDFGGIAFNAVDTQNYYEIAIRDASSPVANSIALFKTVGGVRSSALASAFGLSFTRGTSHVITVSSTNNGTSTTIVVGFDGTQAISYTDSSPLGAGSVGLRNDTFSGSSSALFDTFTATSNDIAALVTSQPSVNYLNNNNFNFGSGGWPEVGTLTGRITFPTTGTYGTGAVATLTFANQAVGSDTRHQDCIGLRSASKFIIPGQQYCFSALINVTAAFTNSYAFIQVVFLDGSGTTLSTTTSPNITTTTGAQYFFLQVTAPANAYNCRAIFGGTTTNTTNSGTATFTGLMVEPVWFPVLYSYPSPICDFLQGDSVTLPDGTSSRYTRIFTGFITHLTASYEGTTRLWDVEVSSAETLLETSALVNASYTNVTDLAIIKGIVNSLPNSPLFAADPTLQSNAPLALGYRNVPICFGGATFSALQFSDATIREILNTLADTTGFLFGTDAYYNVYYFPPFYSSALYAFSSTPNYITSFPYYDYAIEIDGTQLHNAVRVVGTTFPTTVVEAWHFQDGSHTEGVQASKTINVLLKFLPNAVPTTITIGGGVGNISCGFDNGTGYGSASSIISSPTYGTPGLLSFLSPGYAAGVSISVTYAYDTLAYVQVQAPDSVAQYGRALYSKINDTNLGSLASAVERGEAELQYYAQPLTTIKFKTQKLVQVGQTITFTSALDGITNTHYTVQRVTASYLGSGINQYEVEAGTYVDNFVDFFRNTQKAVNRVTHDPGDPLEQINNLQQDSVSIADSLTIHT